MNAQWSQALRTAHRPVPPALRQPKSVRTQAGFDVHRNTFVVSLGEALASTFPVLRQVLGEACCTGLLQAYVREHPPSSPVLTGYGEHLPAFLDRIPEFASLPYLSDLAQLEWSRVQACHASDALPMRETELAAGFSQASDLSMLRLVMHPSVRLLRARHAVVSIWSAHPDDPAEPPDEARLQSLDVMQAESALIVRDDRSESARAPMGLTSEVLSLAPVCVVSVSPPLAETLDALIGGQTLGEVMAAGHPLSEALALLMQTGCICGLQAAAPRGVNPNADSSSPHHPNDRRMSPPATHLSGENP